ncbi:copper homeostasis membrane protein CopD [Bradyrhizobium sp.]
MDWLGTGIDSPLVVSRAVHFAATAMTAGALIFRAVVAEPALWSEEAAVFVRTQNLCVASLGLAVAAASGVCWFLLQAAAMAGLSLKEAIADNALLVVMNETQFGFVSELRLALAITLAGCLTYDRYTSSRWLALASALGLIATIAGTGHAVSGVGEAGFMHLTADVLHLIAAAAWPGGLVSLALLLATARHHKDLAWASAAKDITRRFSTLGIVGVGVIFATGVVNTWMLVGSMQALIGTDYGRLLGLKISLFATMLAIAAANRFFVTPRLDLRPEDAPRLVAFRQLTRNSMIEIALGMAIFGIVGLLGTLHPAIHISP